MPSLPNGADCGHTSGMNLKNAALLALLGTLLLTILIVVNLISTTLNVLQGLVPAMLLLSSIVYAFAGLTVTIFFYVFHKTQR
jgi:hypothetical protein